MDFFNKGAFSVWRGRQKASDDTAALEARAQKLFASSIHKETDLETLSILTMRAAETEWGLDLPLSAKVSLSLSIEELAAKSGLFVPPRPDVDTESSRLAYRRLLKESIRIYEQGRPYPDYIAQSFEAAYSHILGRLARDAASLLSPSPLLRDGPSLRLVDLVSDPDEMVERIIRALFCVELEENNLLETIRLELLNNTKRVSGLPPDEHAPIHKHILPTNYPYEDPAELVSGYLGGTAFEELLAERLPIAIPEKLRFEHTHIVAGSGHGKTQLLSSLILDDLVAALEADRTVVVIDSQGDLISEILSLAVVSQTALADRTIVVDPTHTERPVALNPFALDSDRLESYSQVDRERVIFGAVDLLEHFFKELLGAELTSQQGATFKYLIRLLVEIPGATLLTLRDLMDDPEPFRPYMESLSGTARMFFEKEFMTGAYSQTRSQIKKRLWAVLANPVFERLFSSPENRLDWFREMQSGSLILVNTAKDYLKTEGSALFGRYLTAQIAQGILERATVNEKDRTPTFVYLDEAQEYVDSSIELLLSQGRKYACGVTMAHQYLEQFSPAQRSSVLANSSIKFAGGLNRKDGQVMAGEMGSSSDFLGKMRKGAKETEFALTIRNHLSRAVRLSVPLGTLSKQDKAAQAEVKSLIEQSGHRFGAHPVALERMLSPPPTTTETIPKTSEPPRPPQSPPEVDKTHSDDLETEQVTSDPVPVPTPRASLPQPSEPPSVSKPVAKPSGQGGKEHIYLQNLVKGLAEQAGAKATIEAPILGGRIDVLIEKGRLSIGVEIAVTTSAEHEVQNVQKCLQAEVSEVWLLTKGKHRLSNLKKAVSAVLEKSELAQVHFLIAEQLSEQMQRVQDTPIKEHTHRNYRVKVKTSSPDGVNERRAAVGKIIAKSMRK